jgi:ABC-type polysaccharide/polyol phosphate export permease
MFESKRTYSTGRSLLNIAETTYHVAVRKVRSGHRNALFAIGKSIMQGLLFLTFFYLMFTVLGVRGAALRGDFTLYLLTGIFLYLTHITAFRGIVGSEGPTSAMMLHAPMNTIVAILASALSSLYTQFISLMVILFIIHTIIEPVIVHDWVGAGMMFLLSWFTGCCFGVVLLALKPWMPGAVNTISMIYVRVNMIASGKMFVANMLPGFMIALFDWNPLFHLVDQARGFTFVNYFPRYSNWEYPLYVALTFLVLGLMGEFFTRRRASASWGAMN